MDELKSDDFLLSLADNIYLTETEFAVLEDAGISNADELYSLVRFFPSIGRLGCDIAKLSNAALGLSRSGFATAVSLPASDPSSALATRAFSGGVIPNSQAPILPNAQTRSPSRPGPTRIRKKQRVKRTAGIAIQAVESNIDIPEWLVKNQGTRGTCVAFALTACYEHKSLAERTELSEQYLYCQTKINDPSPDIDGTRLEYAGAALQSHGICEAKFWRYDPTQKSASVSHATSENPSQDAHDDAKPRATTLSLYRQGRGYSSLIRRTLLQDKCPVAVSVPVFQDIITMQSGGNDNNWNSGIGKTDGVINTPPRFAAVCLNEGHAICITGFVSDSTEPNGGYFLFRNSWGTDDFASNPDATRYIAARQGYGRISATYIERYAWEICRI